MSDNVYILSSDGELYHYGVPGMKWGKRKAVDYASKARTARESAKEWDEMAKYAEQRGKTKKAAKYRSYAAKDRADASAYERQTVQKKPAKASKTSPSKRAGNGKKKAKKILQSGAKVGAKTVSIGAQMALRMMQNNVTYGTIKTIGDGMYDA